MADYVNNRLIITCKDSEIKNKIKKMIFRNNEKNEQIFTMTKLLPVPEGLSENPGYTEYGYDWCCAVWGTKWDVIYNKITESGDSYIFNYDTAWDPNVLWVKALCRYIGLVSYPYKKNVSGEISITHFFCNEYEDFGTKMEWTPDQCFQFTENVSFFNR